MDDLTIEQSFALLKKYVEEKDFKGWDPFDGLNSVYFQKSPLRHFKLTRLAWIQFFKRSPINFRKLLRVEEGYNSKGLGLFLSGYCNLYKIDKNEKVLEKIKCLIDKIVASQTKGYSGACWGYNFDWQARAFFQPKYTPTVVATTYVAYSLLDAYEIINDENLLRIARSSCDFILSDLNRTEDQDGNICFSYSPEDNTQIFNASLLASRLLARVYSYTKEELLKDAARKSVAFCCNFQAPDGAWTYGTLPFHQWIDNFHTGFNLECIGEYEKHCNDYSFDEFKLRGFNYYVSTFFTDNGESKYYNNSLFPIDIHAPAQLLVTLVRLNKLEDHKKLAKRVLSWTIKNMQNSSGFFYYQKKRNWNSKIPYMRWAQAWMFYSMSMYLSKINNE